MKAAVTIDWKNVQGYLDTFYPTVNKKIENIELAPSRMTIMAELDAATGSGTKIDFLPVVKFGLYDRHFSCRFNHVKDVFQSSSLLRYQQEQNLREGDMKNHLEDFMRQDGGSLKALVEHRHPKWASDVARGLVVKILISDIGVYAAPKVQFYISQYAQPRLLQGLHDECYYDAWDWSRSYFKSADLFKAFETINGNYEGIDPEAISI
jgi:hypothetical protein